MSEPESLILQMLRQMRAELGDVGAGIKTLDRKIDQSGNDLRSDMRSLGAAMASDLLVHRKETTEQIAGLRRAVIEYHTSVIGHGILISELEARVRRMEQHLNLPSMDIN